MAAERPDETVAEANRILALDLTSLGLPVSKQLAVD